MFSIIGESNVRTFTKESNFKQVYQYACLSTDSKPTTGISNGSTCIVMNTGKTYIFDEENGEWEELPGSGGGGGGGGGENFVKITLNLTPPEGYSCDVKAIEGGIVGYAYDIYGEVDYHNFINTGEWFVADETGKVSFPIIEYAKIDSEAIKAFDATNETELKIDFNEDVTLTGGIEVDSVDNWMYRVTGDCTISATMRTSLG